MLGCQVILKSLLNMLYKDAFIFRDEIGTYTNIEVDIEATDNSPFLLDHSMSKKKTNHSLIKNEKIS